MARGVVTGEYKSAGFDGGHMTVLVTRLRELTQSERPGDTAAVVAGRLNTRVRSVLREFPTAIHDLNAHRPKTVTASQPVHTGVAPPFLGGPSHDSASERSVGADLATASDLANGSGIQAILCESREVSGDGLVVNPDVSLPC